MAEPEHAWNWKKDKVWFETPEEFLGAIRSEFGVSDVRCVPGFRGYAVTPQGRVFSCKMSMATFTNYLIEMTATPLKKRSRRLVLGVYDETLKRNRRINRAHLMALAYLPPPQPWEDRVRHLNDVCDDDRLENLAWGTAQDNADDLVKNGLSKVGEKHRQAKLTNQQAIEVYRLWKEEAKSIRDLATQFSVTYDIIYNLVKGITYYAVTGAPHNKRRVKQVRKKRQLLREQRHHLRDGDAAVSGD